jgi:hypothetical protein
VRAHPTPPVAAAAINEERPAPRQNTNAPPHKHTKTDTASVAEKEPRGQKSAEALVRAALANVHDNRPAPADALIAPGLTDTRSAPGDVQPRPANMPPRQADVGQRPVDVPPRAALIEAVHAADVQPQAVQPRPETSVDLQPRSPDVRLSLVAPVDIQPRPVAAVDPLPPSAGPPLEIAASQTPPPADTDKQVRAGVLSCDVSAGMGLILGSQKRVSCAFAPEGPGRREDYDGSITKFGVDLGVTRGGFMVWAVFTNTVAGPGLLAGDYFGASGEVTVAAGLGANVLVGGSNRTVALQPISVSGQTGLNLAIGVAALHLRLPRQ